jgi:hypothetical protein
VKQRPSKLTASRLYKNLDRHFYVKVKTPAGCRRYAFGVGAHAEWDGDQVDEIAESEDAAEFVQGGGVLEELTLQGA